MNSVVKSVANAAALEASKKWFKEAQFGMMAHWGLCALLGGEWKWQAGKHAYGEWIMHGNCFPLKEYAALAKAFNPICFDAGNWMSWVSMSNKKLIDRCIRLLVELGNADYETAAATIFAPQEWIAAQDCSEGEEPSPVQVALRGLGRGEG